MARPTFIDKIANRWGYVKSVALTVSAALGAREYAPPKSAEQLAAYASWVYGCVKARSVDVSHIELKLFKVKNRKTGEVEEVQEHEALSLIRSVNPFMTTSQLFKNTQSYKDLAGESFWYLQRAGSNESGPIIQIWLLRPDWMEIRTSTDGFVAGYVYKVPGQSPIDFRPDQIIHHKEFNPLNPYRGMSVVRAAAVTIDTEQYAEDFNKKFFRNSAVPEIVLSTEQKLSDAQVKRMHAEWANKYGGTNNAHKTAILEGGLEIQNFSISQKDMEFLQGQAFSRDKILALFEVPKSRLGMTEGVTVSNAEATINIYLKYVVKPLMETMRDELNEHLLPLYDDADDLFFDIEDPVPEDVKSIIERMRAEFEMGALSPNEVRIESGRDEVPGLDAYYLPLTKQPISGEDEREQPETDNPEDKPEGDTAREPARDESGKIVRAKAQARKVKRYIPPMRLKAMYAKRIREKIMKEVEPAIMKAMTAPQPTFVKKAKEMGENNWSEEMRIGFWKQLTGKTDSFEKTFEQKVIEIFELQERGVLERLAKAEKKSIEKLAQSDVEDVLISVVRENKIAADILLPLVKTILEESGTDTMEFLDESAVFDANTEAVKSFMRADALKGIRVMNKTTKSKLRKALSEALADGVGPVQTARKIRDVFTEAKTVRAIRVARTETLKAANYGALEAYKQSGVVAGKQWFTALDEGTCQWCAPMHGKVQTLNTNFFEQGESYVGEKGGIIKLNLDDVPAPPLHPNCRCTLLPITVSQRIASEPHKKDLEEENPIPEDDIEEREKRMEDRIASRIEQRLADKIGEILDAHE